MWIVKLIKKPKQNDYRDGFFPRRVRLKKDALALVAEVHRKGGDAVVEKEVKAQKPKTAKPSKPLGRFGEEDDPCRPTEKEIAEKARLKNLEDKEGADPTRKVQVILSTGSPNDASVTNAESVAVKNPLPRSVSGLVSKLKTNRETGKTQDDAPHLIVEALAGSGKTTTLIEGLKRVKGIPSTLTPSPQQAKVWECMELSKGKAETIGFVAFNKAIAEELKQRVPPGCDAMTMHSLGFKALNRAYPGLRVNSYRTSNLVEELLEVDIRELRRTKPLVMQAVEKLVGLCKMNLTGLTNDMEVNGQETGLTTDALDQITNYYELELEDIDRAEVYDLVKRVMERARDLKDKSIDFNDMIWLPVVLNLPVSRYDLLLIDEAQDLCRCQQSLALKAGKRLVLCGDKRQAIYSFAGADSESIARMEKVLQEGRGVITLPLSVTRRCCKAVVREAQAIVPEFEAMLEAPEGTISNAIYPTDRHNGERPKPHYTDRVQDGDMVLCRVNAPLVSQCFRFLKAGRRANIQGRDVGQGLISTINKLKASDVVDLIGKISDWVHQETTKEQAKRYPSEQRIISLQDRADCLTCFTSGCTTVDQVKAKIEAVFTDDRKVPGIRLSSIHKAKGLEANRVFFLEPEGAGCPHPMAKSKWQRESEMCLRYVAITRAILELCYVS